MVSLTNTLFLPKRKRLNNDINIVHNQLTLTNELSPMSVEREKSSWRLMKSKLVRESLTQVILNSLLSVDINESGLKLTG